MRTFLLYLFFLFMGLNPVKAKAQKPILLDSIVNIEPIYVSLLLNAMEYHQALVKGDLKKIKYRTSKQLRYGHSNGWIETQKEQLKNIETGYLIYHSYKEDSMNITLADFGFTINRQNPAQAYNKNNADLVFNATIDVSLQGKRNTYHLKVAERWMRKANRKKGWQLVGRQADKI